jgi:hypothetical protein
MEVGWMARSLMQEGLVLPAAGQLPQYRPVPQSRVEEHEFPTCNQEPSESTNHSLAPGQQRTKFLLHREKTKIC